LTAASADSLRACDIVLLTVLAGSAADNSRPSDASSLPTSNTGLDLSITPSDAATVSVSLPQAAAGSGCATDIHTENSNKQLLLLSVDTTSLPDARCHQQYRTISGIHHLIICAIKLLTPNYLGRT